MNSRLIIIFIVMSILSVFLLMCRDPEVERKLDPYLRLQVKNLKETAQLDNSISVVFKTNEQLTDEHKAVLEKKGISITGNIGNIYTAKLPAKAVYDLAKMRFTDSIQGSREMKAHPKDSENSIQKF
jgi:hypothetical protein